MGQKMCHKKVPLLPLVQFCGCLIQKIWCSLGVWNKMPFLVAQNRILGSWVPEKQTDFFTPVKTWMDSIICSTMEYQPSCDITLLARHISFVEY